MFINFFCLSILIDKYLFGMIFDSGSETVDHAIFNQFSKLQDIPKCQYNSFLYSSIGIIVRQNSNSKQFGTGFLINSQYLITAAHTCFSVEQYKLIAANLKKNHHPQPPKVIDKSVQVKKPQQKLQKTNSECQLIRFEGSPKKRMQKVQGMVKASIKSTVIFYLPSKKRSFKVQCFVAEEYWKFDELQRVHYDFCLCKLQEPIHNIKYLNLTYFQYNDKQFLQKLRQVSIVGYPFDEAVPLQQMALKRSMGQIHHLQDNIYKYWLSTEKGMSGSPIIYSCCDELYVVGIHTSASYAAERFNIGIRTSLEVSHQLISLTKLADKTKSKHFQIRHFSITQKHQEERRLSQQISHEQKILKLTQRKQSKKHRDKLLNLYMRLAKLRMSCGRHKEAAELFEFLNGQKVLEADYFYVKCLVLMNEKHEQIQSYCKQKWMGKALNTQASQKLQFLYELLKYCTQNSINLITTNEYIEESIPLIQLIVDKQSVQSHLLFLEQQIQRAIDLQKWNKHLNRLFLKWAQLSNNSNLTSLLVLLLEAQIVQEKTLFDFKAKLEAKMPNIYLLSRLKKIQHQISEQIQ